ncbi:TPA: hypothetical protein N0F65_006717 [Lagenidium giganteum]|uniref:C2 domain-containing protein n=1 Tax=Lagenidium giganteum TaxID=4803 RepID=A0AAV2Z8X8_9STRA|nr:TPA: hypothetical protein N0F65_006717 [Lagenidium giganteum]
MSASTTASGRRKPEETPRTPVKSTAARVHSGSRVSFSFSAAPSAPNTGQDDFTVANPRDTHAAQRQFWIAYALAHFLVFEASGEPRNLDRARVGFEKFLAVTVEEEGNGAASLATSTLRVHAQCRLVLCLYWSHSSDSLMRATEVCDQALPALRTLEVSSQCATTMAQQLKSWRLRIMMIQMMLSLRAQRYEDTTTALSALLSEVTNPEQTLAMQFLLALVLMKQYEQSHPYVVEEGDEDEDSTLEATVAVRQQVTTLLRQCHQQMELWRSVGFYHGWISNEKAKRLLQAAPVGAFLFHRTLEPANAKDEEGEKLLLKVKLSEKPTKISALRVQQNADGAYFTKKLPNCVDWSLYGFVTRLPAAAGVQIAHGVRKPLKRKNLALKLTDEGAIRHADTLAGRAVMGEWAAWAKRLRCAFQRHRKTRNEPWSVVCFEVAKLLEGMEAYDACDVLLDEAMCHSRDRRLRSYVCFARARTAYFLRNRVHSVVSLQQAKLESHDVHTGRHAEPCDLRAFEKASSRNIALSKQEAFDSRLARLQKVERMSVKAWSFDSFSPAIRAEPAKEALLLERVDQEMAFADTFFLRSMIKAHVRAFLLGDRHQFDRVHLNRAQVAAVRLFDRFQRHAPTTLLGGPQLSQAEELQQAVTVAMDCGEDPALTPRQVTTARRLRAFAVHVLLLAWQHIPFHVCFEVAEVYYRAQEDTGVLIDMYESLYGRLRGFRPRNGAYVAYEELFLCRLAFLYAKKANRKSARLVRRAMELLDELLASRWRHRSQQQQACKHILWPCRLELPLRLSDAEVRFHRGFLASTYEDIKEIPSDQRQSVVDFHALHHQLVSYLAVRPSRDAAFEQTPAYRTEHLRGIRVYLGATRDLALQDVLHSKPGLVVRCEGKNYATQHPPSWAQMSPSWDEHIEFDVASPHARVFVTLKNRTRRHEEVDVAYVQLDMDDVIAKGELTGQFYDLKCHDQTLLQGGRHPQLFLGVQLVLKAPTLVEQRHTSRRRDARLIDGWSIKELQTFLNGDLPSFVESAWIWSALGRKWFENQEFLVAAALLERGLSLIVKDKRVTKERVVGDIVRLTVCYRALLGTSWWKHSEPYIIQAEKLLVQEGLTLDDRSGTAMAKAKTQLTAWRREVSGLTSLSTFESELSKHTPASSHWIKFQASPDSSIVYFFNQDTGESYSTDQKSKQYSEPLEYEPAELARRHYDDDALCHRIVIMTSEMRARVRCLHQQLVRARAQDPFQWVAVFNVRLQEMQFFSQAYAGTSGVTVQPPTYVLVVSPLVLYDILVLQDAFRRHLRRVQRRRLAHGLVKVAVWLMRELLQARRRLFMRAEDARKKVLNCLHVLIEKADHLRAGDVISSDPFVVLRVSDGVGQVVGHGQTSVRPHTLNPKWHEEFFLPYAYATTHVETFLAPSKRRRASQPQNLKPPILSLTVYDYDVLPKSKAQQELTLSPASDELEAAVAAVVSDSSVDKKNDFLGLAVVPIEPLEHGKCVRADLKLRDEDGYESPRSRGTLTITIEWIQHEEEVHVGTHPGDPASSSSASASTASGKDAALTTLAGLTPLRAVRARKKALSKPSWSKEQEHWLASFQLTLERTIKHALAMFTVMEQALRLEKRMREAQGSGKTAEEAKVLDQRLQAVMKTQYLPQRQLLVDALGHVAEAMPAFHALSLTPAEEYADSFEVEASTTHELQEKLAGLFRVLQDATLPITSTLERLDSSAVVADSEKLVQTMLWTIERMACVRTITQTFYQAFPEERLPVLGKSMEDQLNRLMQLLKGDTTTSSASDRAPASKPVASVEKRLERIQKEKNKQQRKR